MQADSRFNKANISFTELPVVDSTNNYAMQALQNGEAGHAYAWFAHNQTRGKGQRNKNWVSSPGENIAMSIALDTSHLRLSQLFEISVVAAIASHTFFNRMTEGSATIKWPNDIYWCDRKAGGILIENIIKGTNWHFAVIGVGININQIIFDDTLPNPVSLKQITGKDFDPVSLARDLCTEIVSFYELLQERGFDELLDRYNTFLYKKGEPVKLKKDTRVFNCIIKEVNRYGQLITEGAMPGVYDFGEVEWVIR